MTMSKTTRLLLAAGAAAVGLGAAGAASATDVNWADLQSVSISGDTWTVTGQITVGSDVIGVTFVGDGVGFVQTGQAGDINYWTQPNSSALPYTGGSVDDAPPSTDIIALSEGGLKTITFSKPVGDVYMGLVSWNGNTGTFSQPLTVISQGCGFWGCGSFADVTSNSFVGDGELHGIIEFQGNFEQVGFTDVSEFWHGFNVGIAGEATGPVPEPASWALMIVGAGMAGAALRRSKRQAKTVTA